ncbi:hypothetical protein BH11GEM1_BH11GEM1_21600 [soil metagenome]
MTLSDDEITLLIDQQADAWNRGDATAWAACFTDDASFVNIIGIPLAGRREIGERHAMMFRTVFSGSHTEVAIDAITMISGGAALARTTHVVSALRGLPPGIQATDPDGTLRTRMLYVLSRPVPGDAWRVIAGQNTAIVPVSSPTS